MDPLKPDQQSIINMMCAIIKASGATVKIDNYLVINATIDDGSQYKITIEKLKDKDEKPKRYAYAF